MHAPGNYSRFSDDSFDLRLYLARRTESAVVANPLLSTEHTLHDGAAVAPIYFNTKNWLMSPRVHGWREDALWTRDYRGIWIEEKSP
jgi:hypothetical protein